MSAFSLFSRTFQSIQPIAAAAVLWAAAPALHADVKLPAVLGDHMVLQQDMPVPIWGWSGAGEDVTVKFAGQNQSAKADADGKWSVKLSPLTASDQPGDLVVSGKNTLTLKDVLVGEVWLCSGQSNMEFNVGSTKNAQQEIQDANYPQIRLFSVPKATLEEPQSDTHGAWQPCSPQTVGGFSAVGYFFGRELNKELHIPIGLIHSSWGGTVAEAWAQRSYLEKDPDYQKILERVEHEKKDSPNRAAYLYNGMIAPIVPVAIRGTIWYQGEANANRAYQYRKLLPTMIKSWRDAWGEPDMAFLIVSLANFQKPQAQPGESDWAELREAQASVARQPHNGLALAIDLADEANPEDIHPHNKQEVGRRLALVALAKTYGKNVVCSGPEFASMKIEGEKAIVQFKNAEGGLEANGGEPVKGFQIAGEDKKWQWAKGEIRGDHVVLSSDDVKAPVAVRYGWAINPVTNLYNKAGLPTVPFRTDEWKGVTEENR